MWAGTACGAERIEYRKETCPSPRKSRRPARNLAKTENILLLGSVRFDVETGALMSDDGLNLTPRPQTARVLKRLATDLGQLVTKEDLLNSVWTDTHVTDDSLVQCISEIRRALGPSNSKLLVTVPKHGYKLMASPGNNLEAEVKSGLSARQNQRRLGNAIFVGIAAAVLLVAGTILYLRPLDTASDGPVTLAVLPFANLSENTGQEYLSVGLAEDLLIDLSHNHELTVLSRSATFSYRQFDDAAGKIHEELGASHLIDGSVQRDRERIRVSVQLVDTSTGSTVWAERFDREIGELFDLQDDLRERILGELLAELGLYDASAARPADVRAYDMLLRGRYSEASLTQSGIVAAIELYKRAIDIDPSYGDAYARLANMYDFMSRYGWSASIEGDRALALEMAERATRLDPENPFVHWSLARILSRVDGSNESVARAINHLEHATTLEPDYPDAYAFLALLNIGNGEYEASRNSIERAFGLNPHPPSWYIRNRGIISYFEGNYDAAIVDFTMSAEMNPTAHFSRVWLAAALARAGQTEDAEWELEEALVLGAPDTVDAILRSNELIRDPSLRSEYAEGLRAAGVPD